MHNLTFRVVLVFAVLFFFITSSYAEYPQDIQDVIRIIDQESVNYPERQSDLKQFKKFLDNGDFSTGRYVGKNIVEKQRNLRSASNEYPQDIQDVIRIIDQESVNYPERQSDLKQFKKFLDNGDFSTGRYVGKNIVEKQRNLRGIGK
jgi:hypothetical protein